MERVTTFGLLRTVWSQIETVVTKPVISSKLLAIVLVAPLLNVDDEYHHGDGRPYILNHISGARSDVFPADFDEDEDVLTISHVLDRCSVGGLNDAPDDVI